jgi:hypothetical protein
MACESLTCLGLRVKVASTTITLSIEEKVGWAPGLGNSSSNHIITVTVIAVYSLAPAGV